MARKVKVIWIMVLVSLSMVAQEMNDSHSYEEKRDAYFYFNAIKESDIAAADMKIDRDTVAYLRKMNEIFIKYNMQSDTSALLRDEILKYDFNYDDPEFVVIYQMNTLSRIEKAIDKGNIEDAYNQFNRLNNRLTDMLNRNKMTLECETKNVITDNEIYMKMVSDKIACEYYKHGELNGKYLETYLNYCISSQNRVSRLYSDRLPDSIACDFGKIKKTLDKNELVILFTNTNLPIFRDGAIVISNGLLQPVYVSIDSSSNYDSLLYYMRGKQRIYYSILGGEEFNVNPIESLKLKNGKYCIEQYDVWRLSSINELVNIKHSQPKSINNALLIGDLIYYSGDTIKTEDTTRGDKVNQLPFSGIEIVEISKMLHKKNIHSDVLMQDMALEKNFRDSILKGYSIIHIASHALTEQNNSMRLRSYDKRREDSKNGVPLKALLDGCCVLLSNCGNINDKKIEGKFNENAADGILTGTEIAKLDLSETDIVVLSCCNTSSGVKTNEGIVGLQYAFRCAGVKSAIVAYGNIDDKITSEFMIKFYNYWLSGASRHKAFRLAQKCLMKKYPDNPYWASFMMMD